MMVGLVHSLPLFKTKISQAMGLDALSLLWKENKKEEEGKKPTQSSVTNSAITTSSNSTLSYYISSTVYRLVKVSSNC